ncbi:hypothetical protein [Chachezhania antarctica]|uniref:hypothetical protein n=1 Tax=Chachezhania antarctica TaxID=2340860 RepID=UPI0013CF133F|nr:hypothetical protein [Chachezhania antarctica]
MLRRPGRIHDTSRKELALPETPRGRDDKVMSGVLCRRNGPLSRIFGAAGSAPKQRPEAPRFPARSSSLVAVIASLPFKP